MQIKISDHFTYGRLLRFTAPTIATMVFLSIYTIVDGLFVSNCVDLQAFAALNLAWPIVGLLGMPGFIVGTGGGAIVARLLGEQQPQEANRVFSLLVTFSIGCGVVLGVLGWVLLPWLLGIIGAEGALLDAAVLYGRVWCIGMPFMILQEAFQTLFVTAERPNLGFYTFVGAGLANIVLDALFIIVCGWGLLGAAVGSVLGCVVGGLVPVVYFLLPNSTHLRLSLRVSWDGRAIRETCINGSSEAMTNIAGSLMGMLYNYQLMSFMGEAGVSAYGVIMYVGFILLAVLFGQASGSAPIVSYHYGAQNHAELSNIFRKNTVLMVVMGLTLTLVAQLAARPLAAVFVGSDPATLELAVQGLRIYNTVFVLMGLNVFASNFFTALGNGPISALISFFRTLVFEAATVMVLPLLVGPVGLWWAMPVAEALCLVMSAALLWRFRNRYGYTLRKCDGEPVA